MSFPRLRRSAQYPIVSLIYNQVKGEDFYSKQVGLSHTHITSLKNNGYITNSIGINGKKQTTTIITPKSTSYKVKMYHLTQRTIEILEEDIAKENKKENESNEIVSDKQ
jgi:uncharacterized membrane protein